MSVGTAWGALVIDMIVINLILLQDGSLDSFSNVIHYDSALLDQNTGKKQNTSEVEKSVQFACKYFI